MLLFRKTIDPIKETEEFTRLLSQKLQANLISVVLYGSVVRGSYNPEKSDINLLLVLKNASTPALMAINEILRSHPEFSILTLQENHLNPSFELFRPKFQSMARHRKLIKGTDPFINMDEKLPDPQMLKQNILNLLMRMTNRLLKVKTNKTSLSKFIDSNLPGILTESSYLLRKANQRVPDSFYDRTPTLEAFFEIELPTIRQYLKTEKKASPMTLESLFAVIEELQTLLMKSLELLSE